MTEKELEDSLFKLSKVVPQNEEEGMLYLNDIFRIMDRYYELSNMENEVERELQLLGLETKIEGLLK